jgi:hypothetical protein
VSLSILSPEKPVIRRSFAESLLTCTTYEGSDSEAASFGSAFHGFHAAWTLRCQQLGTDYLDPEDIRRLAASAFDEQRGISQARREEFLDLCRDFSNTHTAELAKLIAVEKTLTHDIGWALLTCTVDRLDRTDGGDPDDEPTSLRIIDRKSGFADAFGKVSHEFQAQWYVQMAFLNYPSAKEVAWELDPVRSSMPQEPVVWRRGDLDEWWVETLNRVSDAYDLWASGRGRPQGGPACQFCAKRYSCAMSIEPWRSAPENDDQAEEQFGDLIRLTEALTVRKKALEAYFSDRTPAVWAGHEVGWLQPREPSFRVTAEPVTVKAILDAAGMDGAEVLKVDSEKLSNKGLQNILIVAGAGERALSPPSFKWRRHVEKKS